MMRVRVISSAVNSDRIGTLHLYCGIREAPPSTRYRHLPRIAKYDLALRSILIPYTRPHLLDIQKPLLL